MRDGVYDIAIHTTGISPPDPSTWKSDPPPRTDVQIAPDLAVVQIPREMSEIVMDCCDPRIYRKREYQSATRTYVARYAFARLRDRGSAGGWDSDQALQIAIAVSRLVYPTPMRLE